MFDSHSHLCICLFNTHAHTYTQMCTSVQRYTNQHMRLQTHTHLNVRWENFFSRVNFLCGLLFGVCSTPVLPQWHVKDPGHSAKSAGGKLHLNTHTPLTQRSRNVLTVSLCRHGEGTYQKRSSHATRHGKLGRSRLSSLSHCGSVLA